MKIVTLIARVLLGLIFVVFGLNGFLHFIPMPPPPPDSPAMHFFTAVSTTGYMKVVSCLQILGGLLLLFNFLPGTRPRHSLSDRLQHRAVPPHNGAIRAAAREFRRVALADLARELFGALSPSRQATGQVIVLHDPRCAEYSAVGHPERPAPGSQPARRTCG